MMTCCNRCRLPLINPLSPTMRNEPANARLGHISSFLFVCLHIYINHHHAASRRDALQRLLRRACVRGSFTELSFTVSDSFPFSSSHASNIHRAERCLRAACVCRRHHHLLYRHIMRAISISPFPPFPAASAAGIER